MSEFAPALRTTLVNEGGFLDLRSTTGEVVNQGITCLTLRGLGLMPGVPSNTPRDVPASENEVEIVRNLTPSIIESIYKTQYWDRIHAGEIRYQELADKFFDVHVNTGQAPKMLQRAVNRLIQLENKMNWPGGPVRLELKDDGLIGRKTLDAVNSIDGRMLLGECSSGEHHGCGFRREAESYYRSLNSHYLEAWLERLKR